MGDNFRQVFPDIDTENLPADRFAKFIRVQAPEAGTYEVAEHSYGWVDGVVKDLWTIRPMTEEEKADKFEQMSRDVYLLRDSLIERCNEMIIQVTEPIGNQAWRETLAELVVWQVKDLDPITPPLPRLPVRSPRGDWRKLNVR
jgi:VIT1/CCC1 family predicted Fe2+/Mn2+ transporter